MDYTFKRGNRLLLDGTEVVHLSDYSLSQTISERTFSRNSLFKRNFNKGIINRRLNVGNGSFSFYYSKEPTLEKVLSYVGFSSTLGYFGQSYPSPANLKFYTGNEQLEVSEALITSVDLQLTPSSMGRIEVTFEYPKLENTFSKGTPLPFSYNNIPNQKYIALKVGSRQLDTTISSTLSITRELSWRDSGDNHFTLGELATVGTPIISGQDIIAVVNTNYKESTLFNKVLTEDVIISTDCLDIIIPDARITTRTETGDIFKTALDIKHQSEHLPLRIRRK